MKVFLFSLALLILASCGSGSKERVLLVSRAGLTAAEPTMVYGVKSDGSDSFARKITSETLQISLPNGDWKFQAISWIANQPKCGETSVKLTGTDVAIPLTIKSSGCLTSSWMGEFGHLTYAGSTSFSDLNISFCRPSDMTGIGSYSGCAFYDSMIKRVKVIVPEFRQSSVNPQTGIESLCTTVSGNVATVPLKLPFGTSGNFPVYTILETYISDSCSGPKEEYHFPHGLSQGNPGAFSSATPTSSTSIKLNLLEKVSKKIQVQTVATQVPYQSCNPLYLEFKDGQDNLLSLDTATNLSLECNYECSFHTDPACSSPHSLMTAPAGSNSVMLYVKQERHASPVKVSAPGWAPAEVNIRTVFAYEEITEEVLFHAPNIHEISLGGYGPIVPAAGKIYLYETRNYNRGKMLVESASGGSFTFRFTTYNLGSTDYTGDNKTITACPGSGNCYLDLDSNSPVIPQPSDTSIAEVWWQDFSGSGTFYFNPQGTTIFLPYQ